MLPSMGSQSDSVTEQHQQYRMPHLGRGEDSGYPESWCVTEART